jgi:hypothetical protein
VRRKGSRPIAFGLAAGPLPRTGAEELAAGSGPAAGCVGDTIVDFGRSAEAEAASRAVVELGGECGALALSEVGEVGAFAEVLSEEPVGVFVGAAFPGVMRSGEVDGGAEAALECFVHMELGTVIGSDSVDGMRFVAQDVGGTFQGLPGTDAGELADAHQAALAFDDRYGGRLAAPVYGVAFPIAEAAALGDDGRPLGDHALTGEPAAAVLASVAFPASFIGAPEMAPERAALGSVRPEVEVDRFDAHYTDAFGAQATNDLLGAEVFPQHAFDGREVLGGIALVAPGAAAAAVRLLHREHRAVVAIVRTAVALDLPMNGRAMPAEGSRDLRDRLPLASHRPDGVSFFET